MIAALYARPAGQTLAGCPNDAPPLPQAETSRAAPDPGIPREGTPICEMGEPMMIADVAAHVTTQRERLAEYLK